MKKSILTVLVVLGLCLVANAKPTEQYGREGHMMATGESMAEITKEVKKGAKEFTQDVKNYFRSVTAVFNGYTMPGREGHIMATGELLFSNGDQKPAPAQKKIQKEKTDSLTKAIERANLEAAKKAAAEKKNK